MVTRFAFCASLAVLGLISSARASNLLVNGGLEKDGTTPLNQYGMLTPTPSQDNTALPGWSITSGSVDIVPNFYWQASQGMYSVDLVGTSGLGSISQTVSGLTPGQVYTLTFDLAANPQNGPLGEAGTTKEMLITALGADGVTVLNSESFGITVGTRTLTNMQYASNSFNFTATGTSATLMLAATTPLNMPAGATDSTIRTGPVIDNLFLDVGGGSNPSPEPASLGILGAGAAALLLRRRRGRCG